MSSNPQLFFVVMGFCVLCIMTWTDLKTKKIDDRQNWFMRGIILTLILFFFWEEYWIYLIFLFVSIGFDYFLKKTTRIGKGDLNVLTWLITGLVIVSFIAPLIFLTVFLIAIGISEEVHKIAYPKQEYNISGLPIIFASFIITNIIYFLILNGLL